MRKDTNAAEEGGSGEKRNESRFAEIVFGAAKQNTPTFGLFVIQCRFL